MGEVITFAGLYKADKGQAAAVTFYTLIGAWDLIVLAQPYCIVHTQVWHRFRLFSAL